ncbi:MAG TPA: nucleoside kinase [Anaerolineaceae bacterium]
MEKSAFITKVKHPRSDVEIHLPDGRVYTGARGTPVGVFLRELPEWENPPIVGAIVNSELRELTYPIEIEARVKPVTMSDPDGARIYRRSLIFLLQAAFEELFPDDGLRVDYSVASGGYYCQTMSQIPLTRSQLNSLEKRMRTLVQADIPFERAQVSLQEAVQYFKAKNQEDKANLLKYRQKDHLVLYGLGEHRDYHHGYMVPSTGYIRWFDLVKLGDGFVVHFPHRTSPKELVPIQEYPKLLTAFREYGAWLSRLGISDVGSLNDAIEHGKMHELILVSEAFHERRIAEIAASIVEHSDTARIVLIAGPSSSGKTTFSKRLAIQLLAQGISPYPVEMDNYFVDRELTPKDANGQYDFEALETLNLPLLADQLEKLCAGEEVQLPHYNFKTGLSEPGEVVQLKKEQLLILEGIHGLDPKLLPNFPVDRTYRIYVSCLTQLNLDRYNRISTTDTRLLRRIVRDARERGYTAQKTIQRWESVQAGEKKHIFPYQENANVMFNSALAYDLSALKSLAEPLLRQVPYGTEEYIEAKRLLAFLEWFLPIDINLIPENSILKEFIGGSIFQDFKLEA